MSQIENRKEDHVRIALEKNVAADHNYWDDVSLIHNALPEINIDDINLSTSLLNKALDAPLVVAGMTGGYHLAREINDRLAAAAEHFQVGMGVGSQRAAIENASLKETYNIIKDYDIPLRIGNIGASQLVMWGPKKTETYAEEMIAMIDAHAIAICLNFLQEVVQFEGEAHAKGCMEGIIHLADTLDVPVIVKESGAGISYDVAKRLSKTEIAAIDVGGMGGTSFAAIEHYRAKLHFDELQARGGKTFWNWGISTPESIMNVRAIPEWKIPLIATGGIRNGLDAAKALALGADIAGVAYAFLKPATKTKQSTILAVDTLIKEIQASMFLTGCDTIKKISDLESEAWI